MYNIYRHILVVLLSLISVCSFAQLNADFSADTTSGCGALGVQFNDQSTGNISSWSWTFGNGNNSSIQSPFENYNVGSYTVSLTVSDGINSDTETKTAFITVYSEPTASFTFSPSTGCTPLKVDFVSTSTPAAGAITDYIWDVKDGSTIGNISNPSHTYQNTGPYRPSLQIIDANACSNTKISQSLISPTPSPIANFTSQSPPLSCTAPLTVNFVDSTQGSNLTYSWDFGDGATSTAANPSHTYTSNGRYTVSLIVSDPLCSDTIIKTDFVRIQPISVDFTTDNDSICLGETIEFTNLSQTAQNFSWDFDDGSALSFARQAIHTYKDTGWFDVTLRGSLGSSCTDQKIKSIYVQKPHANFGMDTSFNCELPNNIRFTDSSLYASIYDWRIGAFQRGKGDTTYLYDSASFNHRQVFYRRFTDSLIITSKLGCKDTLIRNDRYAEEFGTKIKINGSFGTYDDYGNCLPIAFNLSDSTYGPGTIISYNWDLGKGNFFSSQTPPGQFVDSVSRNYYFLTVTNNFGCRAIDTALVAGDTIHDPAFSVFPDTLCMNDTLTIQMLNSIGNIYNFSVLTQRYTLSYVEDVINTGYFSGFKDTGYHQIVVRAGTFCDTTLSRDSAFYVLGPVIDPKIDADCNFPRTIDFTGHIYGETRFYWDFNDGSPIDSTNKNPRHTFPDDRIYSVVLTAYNDANPCPMVTDTLRIDLFPRLLPQVLPFKKYHCRNNQDVRLYFNNSLLYDSSLWYLNGAFLGNFEDSTFSKDQFRDGENSIYLVGVDQFGCKDTVNDFVYISNPRANFSSNPLGGCIPFNAQMIDLSSSDTSILSWEWLFSNKPNDTFRIQNPIVNINTTDPIEITLSITDQVGCTADTTIEELIKGSELSADFSIGGSTEICIGDTIQLFNRTGGENLTSIWDFGDGSIDTINSSLLSHQYVNPGNFSILLIVIDKNGCIDSLRRYNISVENPPIALFTADTTIANCYPFPVNFQDTSIGAVTAWVWDLGSGDQIRLQNPFRNYESPGNYDVQLMAYTDNGCGDTLLKQDYIQISGPTASFSMDKDTACLNEPINFQISSQNGLGSYRWAFGDGRSAATNPTSHAYTDTVGWIRPSLIIRDVLGNCEVFIQDSVYIVEVISDFTIEDSSGCQPFQPQITNLMQGADFFSWDLGDGRKSTEREPNFTYDAPGTYQISLTVSSNSGCTDVSTASIEVFQKPLASISGDSSICVGDSSLLIGGGNGNYSWYLGDSLLSMNSNLRVSPDSTSSYSLVVVNSFNCSDTANFEVYVQQAPNFIALNDTTIIIGEELYPNISAGQGFIYSWSPAYGLSCTDCPNPTMKPLTSTIYTYRIRDALGCFDISGSIAVEVLFKFTLDVPQAFSPNGDGINDVIYAKGWGLKELISFKIYNRFGELVFEGNDFDKGWDGTYNGKDQVVETYVYTVEARTYADEILMKKGNITLLR